MIYRWAISLMTLFSGIKLLSLSISLCNPCRITRVPNSLTSEQAESAGQCEEKFRKNDLRGDSALKEVFDLNPWAWSENRLEFRDSGGRDEERRFSEEQIMGIPQDRWSSELNGKM